MCAKSAREGTFCAFIHKKCQFFYTPHLCVSIFWLYLCNGFIASSHPRTQLYAYAGFNIFNSEPIISFPQNYAFFGLGVTWLIWHP